MDNKESLPGMDDVQVDGQSEKQLLDAVMQGSELAQAAGLVPLPDEEIVEDGPVESDEQEEDQDADEAVSEDEGEEIESEDVDEVEDAAEEAATQEAEVYTADDLDLDAKVSVKIDGEETEVSFGDLLKGYTTEQSLSKKGREKARADGDTYEVNELKDKREQAQKQYWDVRNQREGMIKAVEQERQKVTKENWEKEVKHFQDTIPSMIPDFNEGIATKIRDFAISEGINPAALDTITDPGIVKFVDDFRRLKESTTKGAAKRKINPAKKALPTKKPKSTQKKAADRANSLRAKAFAKDSSKSDQDAFLKQLASNSLNL